MRNTCSCEVTDDKRYKAIRQSKRTYRSPRQSVSISKSGIGIRAEGFSGDNNAFWVPLSGDFQKDAECQSKDHEEHQKCQEDHEEAGSERPIEVPAKDRIGSVHILINIRGQEAKHLVGAILALLDRFDCVLQALTEGVLVVGRFVVHLTRRTDAVLDVALPKLVDAGLLLHGRGVGSILRTTRYFTATTPAQYTSRETTCRHGGNGHILSDVGLPPEPSRHRLAL